MGKNVYSWTENYNSGHNIKLWTKTFIRGQKLIIVDKILKLWTRTTYLTPRKNVLAQVFGS